MDYLQYAVKEMIGNFTSIPSFKPYYKWITFNTLESTMLAILVFVVLNLIINGLPSIRPKALGDGM